MQKTTTHNNNKYLAYKKNMGNAVIGNKGNIPEALAAVSADGANDFTTEMI